MCAAQLADQAGFSTMPAGIPLEARNSLSAARGLAAAATAIALKRRPYLTGRHPDNPGFGALQASFQVWLCYASVSPRRIA